MKREKAFKLADPGFAKFVRKPQDESPATPKQVLSGGTETYGMESSILWLVLVDKKVLLLSLNTGAPEYPGQSKLPVSQAIDIWSLGCVFSLAATWIILGRRGVRQFQVMRQLAIKELQPRHPPNTSINTALEPPQGDHFHDGHQVLQDVTTWHAYLRTVLRKSDTITSQVLDLVDKQMLLGSAERRITATKLCSKLDLILTSRPESNTSRLPNTIVTALGEYAFTRDLRRPSSFERPLRTTYRQPLWPDQNSRVQRRAWLENEDPNQRPAPTPTPTPNDTAGRMKTVETPERMLSDPGIPTTPRRSRRRVPKKTHSPINVFQARQALDVQRKEKTSFSKILHRTKQDEFQDGLLTSYFQGARDIVGHLNNLNLPISPLT